jgi:serine/threonine protein kinase
MKVYCTRPITRGDEPHIWNIPKELILGQRGRSLVLTETERCRTCGMPLILDHRYVPTKELGHGGFGKTFLAVDRNFPDSVRVIKQFSTAYLLPGQIIQAEEAFKEESRILDQLKHPKIPKIFSYFLVHAETDPTERARSLNQQTFFYMAQEYIEGQDLQRLLQDNETFSEKKVVNLLKQILEVLEYIHSFDEPVIHCDIKPSNIIYNSQDKTYCLIDFGAFQRTRIIENLSQVSPRLRFMSPGFSPPEQAQYDVDASSDLYALAMTCICLLTGKISPLDLGLPKDRNTWKEYVEISPSLTCILSKMIESEVIYRHKSAKEILRSLDIQQTETNPNFPTKYNNKSSEKINKNSSKGYLKTLRNIGISVLTLMTLAVLSKIIYDRIFPGPPPETTIMKPISPQPKNITDVGTMPSKITTFGGSSTWTVLSKSMKNKIMQYFPGTQIQYTPYDKSFSNSEHGIEMLIEDKIDFATSSKRISGELKKIAQEKGVVLEEALVAKNSLVVVVNPMLDISSLTKEQIDDISNGKITNWNQVGSKKKINITIYSKSNLYFPNAKIEKIYRITEEFQKIASNLGGMGIVSAALAIEQCKVKILPLKKNKELIDISPWETPQDCDKNFKNNKKINQEKLKKYDYRTENLSVVIKKDGGNKQKSGETFANMILTSEGQDYVQEAGYLKIR